MFRIIVKAMIVKDKKILVLKRSLTQALGPGVWEMVGGKVELEETLEDGLQREVKEETGLTCTISRLLYATDHNITIKDTTEKIVLLVYLCQVDKGPVLLSNEHSAYRWVDVKTFKELVYEEIVSDMMRYGALSIEEIE